MLKTLGLTLSLGLALSRAAFATDCKSDNLSQADLNHCSGEDFRTADALLNKRYKAIVGCLRDKARPLVEAQRAWIKFRDGECAFQGSATEGGSFQPTAINTCMARLTTERATALDYYLTCQEGDLSCPTNGCDFGKVGRAK